MRKSTFHQAILPNLSVRILHDVLIEAGLNARLAFARAGLDESVANQPAAMVTACQELELQRGFAELTVGRPDLWIEAGNRYSCPTLGVRGFALMTALTLSEWVESIKKGVDLYYAFAELHSLTNAEGEVYGLSFCYNDAPSDLAEFAIHRDVVAAINSLNYLWRGAFPLTEVNLALNDVSIELRNAIQAPIRMRQPVTQIIWTPSLSSKPLSTGNELLYKQYSRQAEEQLSELRMDGALTEQIVLLLSKPGQLHLDLNEIAAQLHTSVRTLQRRLDKLGVHFRVLRDQARFDAAKKLLTCTALPISEIAWRLGYTESASFSSAFKRWSNAAPSDYRSAAVANRTEVAVVG